ncbi:MAG: hypothetical protein M1823_000507 [Watsoniomyces obsoletus]|nr:MAG: hypothetical protein M1823_000507 [Watsoniomyces obsoletus]
MALQPPLRPARSVRKPNSTEPLIQEKSSLEIVRSGSIKSRPVKKRDSIDLAKQSHAFRNAPLPPLPPMQRSETSPVRRQDVDAPPVPSKIPGDGRPIVLPSSPHPARKLSLRRKQKTAPDILVPGQRPQWDISSSPRRNEVNGRQSLGGGEATPPGSGLMISHTSSLSDELGQGECPQEKNMKMGRWNLLGGLFAKKASTSAPTSPPSRTPRDSSSSGEKSMTEGKGGRFRSRSKSRGARNRDEFDKPTFNRAKTAPFRVEHISKPLPPLGTEVQLRSGSVPRSRAMLDVEIPNVELERYSVMFGDVLGDSNSLEKDQTPMDVPRGRQQSTPTSHPRNVERGMGLAKSRGHRGNSRNLSIDLGLSIFPPSPSLKPSPLKPRNHRRSRTLADLKLSDSPSITGFIVQAPPVKPSPPRSRAIGGISRYGDKMSPLPPPPPPPIPKSAKDLIPLIRVASSRPMESGAAIQQTRTVVMKQQSSVNPTWEIPPHSNGMNNLQIASLND